MKKWYTMIAKGSQKGEINIYDEIGLWGISAKDFATDLKALGDIKVLDVHINSPGGSVIDGIAIYNSIKQHSARVNVYIDGVALSMGSVIAMSGDFVYMAENALLMIHNPFGGAMGDAEELRKTAEVMDKMKGSLVISYRNKTGMSEEAISDLMDEETWMTAAEALELGFIDEVTAEVELAASFDLSKFDFKNSPSGDTNSTIENSLVEKLVDAINNVADTNITSAVADKTTEENNMLTEAEKKAAAEKLAAAQELAVKAAVEKAAAVESSRKSSIVAMFEDHPDHKALLQTCLVDGHVTAEDASVKLLDAIGKASKATPTGEDGRIETLVDSRDKFRAGALEAMEIRSGNKVDDGKNEFRGNTLLDMAKASLKIGGVSITGMDKMRIVAAAFTHSSSDFPFLLENSLGKELRNAYGQFGETWSGWADKGSVPDFKLNSRIQLGSFNSLDLIPEGGEYDAGSFSEERETIQAQTKGKMITFTRQAVINDDLGGFMRIARMMGRAAQRTIGNDVYTRLQANPVMSDGVVLFHANHNNLPTGAAPTAATLGAARTLMRKQQDKDANDYLDISPVYIVSGVELEDTINVLLASETDPSQANSRKPNPVRNMVQSITDPRLSATEWYLVAGAGEAPLMEVAFLDGNENPYLESKDGFTVDGVMWKVRLDYGIAPIDFRGGVKGN